MHVIARGRARKKTEKKEKNKNKIQPACRGCRTVILYTLQHVVRGSDRKKKKEKRKKKKEKRKKKMNEYSLHAEAGEL